MDPEKVHEMRELLEKGRPVTDEGPFYHHAWWEAYKGSVKGKLGGGALGAVIGGIAGTAFVAALPVVAPVAFAGFTTTAVATTIAGFSAAGLAYGVHEFSDVGKVAGAVAATQKDAENRINKRLDAKLGVIEEKLDEITARQTGATPPEKKAEARLAQLEDEQNNYRTMHLRADVADTGKIVYWKVALVGLAVGAIAGLILATGGMGEAVLHGLGIAESPLAAAGIASVVTAMAAVGASFGINRDVFRAAFDKTDLWFRGFVSHEHSKSVLLGEVKTQEAQQQAHKETVEKYAEIATPKEVVMFNGGLEFPESSTYHRDKLVAADQRALATLDHSQMARH